ncbi:MFS transporter [Halioglobus maricola]|uniref:MFS transporter n=1 Tax=Halioglobus maricola TaxID=2601894 RepID=UPI0014783360|nr:MFS transporter [Halioglobus maricola]
MRSKNLLDTTNGRFLTFGLLYISEGIPYGFTSTAMVAIMRKQGLNLEQIGVFVAALFLPWAFKWAWAPLIDLIKLPRIGGRKAWIVFCTVMMIITVAITGLIDFAENFHLVLMMVVLNNVFCATQDVAIDSLAVNTLREEERGRGNGFMFGGQYLGIALGGGVAIFVYGQFGIETTMTYISGMLLMTLLFVLFFVKDPEANPNAPREPGLGSKLIQNLVAFVKTTYDSFWRSGPGPKLGTLLALLPMGTMALAYATLGTLQVDYGLDENQIAALTIYNTIASGAGCLVGGWLGDRYGLKRTLFVTYILTALPTLLLATQIQQLGLAAVPAALLYGAIIGHGLLYGMCFGVCSAVFMGMTNPAVAATQFTAYMGMKNLAISFANYWQGSVAESYNYSTVLYLDSLFILVPLMIIPFLRNREPKQLSAKDEALIEIST